MVMIYNSCVDHELLWPIGQLVQIWTSHNDKARSRLVITLFTETHGILWCKASNKFLWKNTPIDIYDHPICQSSTDRAHHCKKTYNMHAYSHLLQRCWLFFAVMSGLHITMPRIKIWKHYFTSDVVIFGDRWQLGE